MGALTGSTGLVVGVANERSLAWGIARAAAEAGARVSLAVQNERLAIHARPLAESIAAPLVVCDLADDQAVGRLAEQVGATGALDFLVHAVAFAERAELTGRFVETSRPGFAGAVDISVYSLIALTRALLPALRRSDRASVITLSFLGATRVFPHYNVMGVAKAALEATVRYLAADLGPEGIRVNALSAGPFRTLSASGVPGLRALMAAARQTIPLRRDLTLAELGEAAVFLLSSASRGITGEVIQVDGGLHLVGAAVPPEGAER